jgi:hypothetical protein
MKIRGNSHAATTAAAGLALGLLLFPVQATPQNCAGTSVGLLPLTELRAGVYKGSPGGLYPGGSNTRPAAHEEAGLAAAHMIRPLDSRGIPDDSGGKIVFLSIGMSNTTQEFSTFKPMADVDLAKNPYLVIVDGAQGGMTASIISDLANPNGNGQRFWNTVDARLSAAGVVPAQVQIAWIKEADAGPTAAFPNDALTLKNELAAIARILQARFPNIRLTYCSSRIYAGYASTTLNPEPFAYQSGFAVKWLIEDQINGIADLNCNPDAGPVMAPWLAWGPYLWADGMTPRSDGLTYRCSDFNPSDGTHPAAGGAREKVAQMLLQFLKSDSTARIWFLRDGRSASIAGFPALVAREHRAAPSGGGIITGIAVANLDPAGADLTYTAFDAGGSPIHGEGLRNPMSLPLAAGAQLPRMDYQIFGEGFAAANPGGWLRMDCTSPRTSAFFLLFDEALSVLDGTTASYAGTGAFVLPEVGGSQEFAEIRVANPDVSAAQIRFELFDSAGRSQGTPALRTIPGSGVLAEALGGLFPGSLGAARYVRATADHLVVPLLLWGSAGRYIQVLAGQDTGSGAATLYSPQYAVGGLWRSTLSVVNLDSQAGQVSFEFTERSGNTVTRNEAIAARGKIYIEAQDFFADPDSGLREGFVKITSNGVKLAGSVVFGDRQRQSCASALPLVSALQNEVIFSQLASNGTYYTGIALMNPGNTEAHVTVAVYHGSGQRVANPAITLEPKSSRAFVLTSLLPELTGQDLISGYVRVFADQAIACFALYGTHDGTALSAIPPQMVR